MNIYEKLSAITSELTRVAKNLQVGEGKFSYKAVGEADVLAAVKPLEEKYKIYSYPASRTVIESGVLENTTTSKDGATNVKKNLYLRIETVYRFVNTENPDEYVDITTYGDGVDPQDKAVGKAMTYSDKYGLMKAYKIMTGDDPDQNPSGELKGYDKKTVTPKAPAKHDYRQFLIDYCNRAGLNINDIAKEHKLNANSTPQDFLNVLTKLGVEVKVN